MATEWLKGWPTLQGGKQVLIGAGVHCIGCGEFQGLTCIAISEGHVWPKENPDWPFELDNCPVCYEEPYVENDNPCRICHGTGVRPIGKQSR